MDKKVAVLPGDGIGPEVVNATLKVLNAVTNKIEYTFFDVGYQRFLDKGEAISNETIEEIKNYDAVFFGAVSSPPGKVVNYRSPILTMRTELDLYANIRPVKSYFNKNPLDTIIFRENTEGLYSKKSFMRGEEAVAEKIVTRVKSLRIAELAYEKAREWGRKKVTIVQKANVLRLTDGLFLDVCKEVASKYPDIETHAMYIDNACYQMAKNPHELDVLLTMNLYGDILGDLAAGLTDGLGCVPSGQFGEKWALFEPVHGSAPDIVGQNKANPIAAILSAKMMLEYIDYNKEAQKIQSAVKETLTNQRVIPCDNGGQATTQDIVDVIIKCLEKGDN